MLLSDQEIFDLGIVEGAAPPSEKTYWNNILSYGFSSAGYDVRLGKNFKFQKPKAGKVITISGPSIQEHFRDCWGAMKDSVIIDPGTFVLAHTLEILHMPANVCGVVRDKSTLARLGLAVQNTVLEPGWTGSVTLEISNHNNHPIRLHSGMPIAQIQFEVVRGPVTQTYTGRYQNQPADVVTPIMKEYTYA